MIAAPLSVNTSNMTAEQTSKEEASTDAKDCLEPPRRRVARSRNNNLSLSLNAGTARSARRSEDATLKSSFNSSTDRRAGLAGTHGRLSQSFIDMNGTGLDKDMMDEILKGFDDEEEDKKDESDALGAIKSMGAKHGINRRSMLQSIESQKSMHFKLQDDDDE
jgi:hypothetical protein